MPKESLNYELSTFEAIRASINSRLEGKQPISSRRKEQIILGELSISEADIQALISVGLQVNSEKASLAPDKIHELSELILQVPTAEQPQITEIVQNIIANPSEESFKFKFPRESVFYRIATIILILVVSGALSYSHAFAQMPTVTPTPATETQPKTATPMSTAEEEENQLPTVTPTPRATSVPRATATPEITASPETAVDYAVVNSDGTNLRQGPSTDTAKIGVADAGDRFKMTGEEEQVGTYTWYEVYLEEGSTSQKGWFRGDLITVKTETVPAPVQPSEAITQTQNITATEVVTQGVVDTEAVGGTISEQDLESRAEEIFGADVVIEADETRMYPIAKIDKFVVGEFLGGEWQQIQEIKILSEEQLSWYPDTSEKLNEDNIKTIVQDVYGSEIVIAVWDEKLNSWIEPTKSSLELTQIAQEKKISMKKIVGTESEAQENMTPKPYEYVIIPNPTIKENDPQLSRSLIIEGIVSEGFRIVELPIQKQVGENWVDTGWKLRLTVLPVSSTDASGQWYTDNIITGGTQNLVDPSGKIYFSPFIGEPTTSDGVEYSDLPNEFKQNQIYNSSYPFVNLENTNLEDGDVIAAYNYGITDEDTPQFHADVQSVKALIGDFRFQEDAKPTADQVEYIGVLVMKNLMEGLKVPGIVPLNDELLTKLIESGSAEGSLDFYGVTGVIHKIRVN